MITNKKSISKKMKNFLFFICTFSSITSLLLADFNRDSSGVVADSKSGLAWQDNYMDSGGEIKSAIWQDALIYCEELTLGGKNDWRLPNIIELKSIADKSKYKPAISSVFQKIIAKSYWSSTTVSSDSSSAWFVGFYSGGSFYDKNNNGKEYRVRCVRGGQ